MAVDGAANKMAPTITNTIIDSTDAFLVGDDDDGDLRFSLPRPFIFSLFNYCILSSFSKHSSLLLVCVCIVIILKTVCVSIAVGEGADIYAVRT
jgi:hypothetical protein